MKILFAVRDEPSANGAGYKKRNFYLVEQLLAGQQKLTVLPLGNEPPVFKKMLALLTSFLSPLPYAARIRSSGKIRRKISGAVLKNNIDTIICDGIHQSLNIPVNGNLKKVLFEHNIESEIIRRYAENETGLLKRMFIRSELRKFLAFQARTWRAYDLIICCSEQDKQLVLNTVPNARVKVIPNGVAIEYFSPDFHPVKKHSLVYTGQIGWKPNEDALLYFADRIYPLIKQQVPDTSLFIVGADPSARIKALAENDHSVTVTGFVPDVRQYIGSAHVYIAPIRIGSGTRLKILEALSMKKPVVTTGVGCEGLDVNSGKHLIISNDPEEFAGSVVKLFNSDQLCRELGENGRRLVEEHYGWKTAFAGLDEILRGIK